ncbi:unnamed protein product [Ambrosiozyma monospora]|uniref:Unnamed protein product n=1 Tax=Ambrosiozyma monospora TaxID=43982 RepID=A0A9W7DD76_AMBMO|nr:unnamed protein product [Ambrosiozyma monospora]
MYGHIAVLLQPTGWRFSKGNLEFLEVNYCLEVKHESSNPLYHRPISNGDIEFQLVQEQNVKIGIHAVP